MQQKFNLKPFLSVVLIILTLFVVVFLQMEERRMGYSILVKNRELKKAKDEKRAKSIQLAKSTRPQHVEQVATTKFTLKKVQANQIIHLTGDLPKPAVKKEM
jgi:biopolymer transport protein ExbD